jgi:hypothetical protein
MMASSPKRPNPQEKQKNVEVTLLVILGCLVGLSLIPVIRTLAG